MIAKIKVFLGLYFSKAARTTYGKTGQCSDDLIHLQSSTDTRPAQLIEKTLQVLLFHTFNNIYDGTNQIFAHAHAATQYNNRNALVDYYNVESDS